VLPSLAGFGLFLNLVGPSYCSNLLLLSSDDRSVDVYGSPKDFDGSMFFGRTVGLVSFSVNTIHITFDGDISITLQSSFEHRLGAEGTEQDDVQQVPVKESRLMQLAGRTVERVEANVDGTLTLHFNGGHVLRCFDDSLQYECYRITHGKEVLYV
jgi:hypothetical protein